VERLGGLVSIVGALNRAYEGRPWWKVRLNAIA